MKPVLTDRMAVIVLVASLGVWTVALNLLWGWAFDPSGSFAMLVWLAILLVAAVSMGLRFRLARMAPAWLGSLPAWRSALSDALHGRLSSSREDNRRRMRLLSLAAVLAIFAMLAATLWIWLAALLFRLLGDYFLLSDFTWRAMEVLALGVGAIGPAGAWLAIIYAARVVRAGSGRDTYAAALRDVLWGLTLGLGVLAVSWWFGADLRYLVGGLAAAMLLSALTAVSRGELATHPRKKLLPFGPPGRLDRPAIAATLGGIVLALLVQLRLLEAIFSLSVSRQWVWMFLTLFLLGFFLTRTDRKNYSPGRLQRVGLAIGLSAGLLAQVIEWSLCLRLDSGARLLAVLGVATQIPLASLAATLLSAQRRSYALCGGSAGGYILALFFGAASGLGVYLLSAMIPQAWHILPGMALAVVAAAGINGAWHARRRTEKPMWVAWSVLLAGALAAGFYYPAWGHRDRLRMQPGLWLTPVGFPQPRQRRYEQHGLLASRDRARSDVITECLAGVFSRRKGRWWMIASDARDLPATEEADIYIRVYPTGSNPQAPPQPRSWDRWPPLSYSHPDFFRYARLNFVARVGYDYYDAVFLAPLPADHPQAWRCYNQQMIRRVTRCVWSIDATGTPSMNGLVVLRTQVDAGNVRRALSVARTYHREVQPAWALVAVMRDGLDMLLLGPEGVLGGEGEENLLAHLREIVRHRPDVFLVPISELWEAYPGVDPIRLVDLPGERLADTPHIDGLRSYLEKTRELIELRSQAAPPPRTDTP